MSNIRKQLNDFKSIIRKESSEFKIINDYHMYLWNTDGDTLVEVLFDEKYSDMEEHRQQYVEKFRQTLAQDPSRLWSMLDNDKRQQLIDAVTEKYG